MRVVIVGAGQGGLQAAMSLRQEGHDGPITMIGAEPVLPYQRPPLSKTYLKTGEAEKLALRPEAFFVKNAIDLELSTFVDAIDRERRQVRAGRRVWDYDHLIVATGTRNLRPPIKGIGRALELRTLEDAKVLRDELTRPRRIAVIGGGFIGLEFAAVARTLGHEVAVAEAAPRLMARVLSPEMSDRFLEMHCEMGTDIRLGQPVVEVADEGIRLADGQYIAADLVLLAAGVAPNTDLASGAGLSVANGIVTDAQLRTEEPAISALGDCAAFPDHRTGRCVRLESVQAATDHARAIAKRLVKGETNPYNAVPWFWSDQADWKLQIAGLAGQEDETVLTPSGSAFRFCDNHLTAVETINDAKTHMRARKFFAGNHPLSRDLLEQSGYDLSVV